MKRELEGSTIWITGAGSGIGEACARLLARRGARLVLSGRKAEALHKTAGALECAPANVLVLPGDLSDRRAVSAQADAILSRFARIDALVNCVGVNVAGRELQHLSSDVALDVIRGNLDSAFLLTLAVLPPMRAQGGGTVVHVSSWSARHFSPKSGAAYTAAKQGVVALCHSINVEENANGIRACAICPSEVNTGFLDKRPEPPDRRQRQVMLQPDDVADTVLFALERRSGICLNEIVLSGCVDPC